MRSQTQIELKLHAQYAGLKKGRNDAKCLVVDQRVDGLNLPEAKSIRLKESSTVAL